MRNHERTFGLCVTAFLVGLIAFCVVSSWWDVFSGASYQALGPGPRAKALTEFEIGE